MRAQDPLRSQETLALIRKLVDEGARRLCVILRHSARHFPTDPALEPFMGLTEAGKDYAMDLGAALPLEPGPVFFSSPFGRCIETACIMDKGYIKAHGRFNGHNTLSRELSPFYVKDIEKAVVMASKTGSRTFLRQWFDRQIPPDVIEDPEAAAETIAGFMTGLLGSLEEGRIALCVSHDWNIYPLKEFKLGLPHEEAGSVGFLEAVAVFEHRGRPHITHHQKGPVPLV
jgi:broad specificity phosphatase PhoE